MNLDSKKDHYSRLVIFVSILLILIIGLYFIARYFHILDTLWIQAILWILAVILLTNGGGYPITYKQYLRRKGVNPDSSPRKMHKQMIASGEREAKNEEIINKLDLLSQLKIGFIALVRLRNINDLAKAELKRNKLSRK